jgi:2-dehydro-3-deoxygluconokinase
MAVRFWTIGEPLAVLIPTEIAPAEQCDLLRVRVGGAELNVAIGLSRLDHDVTFIGVVGNDPWGRRVLRELRAEGVDVRVRTDSGHPTGAYLRERRASGLTRATYLRRGSAGAQLEGPDLSEFQPGTGDVVHLTGITPALSDAALAVWLAAAETARSRGAVLSLDINHRSALWTSKEARSAFCKIAHLASTVLAGTDEASLVTNEDLASPADAVEALRRLLPHDTEVVIKDGASGSLHVDSTGRATQAAAIALTPHDVVGAGDAFAAGYLSALADGLTPGQRLERAHACAAFVVSTDGDWEGAPRRHELAAASSLASLEVSR